MKILRSMGTVGGLTLGSRIFGFLRDMLIASVLGAGAVTDSLVIAIKIPSLFRRLLAEGALSAAFVPMFTRIQTEQNMQKAKDFAEEILSLLFWTIVVLVIVFEIFMPYILPITAPGLDATTERFQYTVEFSRICFPFILFISLCGLYSSILNSFEKFSFVASSPLIGNLSVILFVSALLPFFMESKGHLFAVAIMGCGIVQFIWVLVPTHKQILRLRLTFPRLSSNVKKFLKLMGPVALSSGMHQFNVLIGICLSSLLPVGGISYLYYAERLNQLPTSIVGTALATVMLPLLSKQIRSKNLSQANNSQNQAIEFALLLTLPAMLGLACLAEPIIVLLFQKGEFTRNDALQTSYALTAFSTGLPAYIIVKLFSSTFYAYEDTKTPLVFAIFSVLFDIVIAVILLKPLGHIGIAIATSMAAWFYAISLGVSLYKKGYFIPNDRLLSLLPKQMMACLIMATTLLIARYFLQGWVELGKIYQFGALSISMVIGIVVYIMAGYWLKVINPRDLKQQFAKN